MLNGSNSKTRGIEKTNPPIVPEAKAFQNTSFDCPTIKGINPSMVDTIVNSIGTNIVLQAFM